MKYIVSHWLNHDSRLVIRHGHGAVVGRAFRATDLNRYSFSVINDVGATVVRLGVRHKGWCYGWIVC